jgi:hypothetical protein
MLKNYKLKPLNSIAEGKEGHKIIIAPIYSKYKLNPFSWLRPQALNDDTFFRLYTCCLLT